MKPLKSVKSLTSTPRDNQTNDSQRISISKNPQTHPVDYPCPPWASLTMTQRPVKCYNRWPVRAIRLAGQ